MVAPGARVTVHAVGERNSGNKFTKFWSTRDPGQLPFTYRAGDGKVIKGWDAGAIGMCVGEVRVLDVPANEAYGTAGNAQWNIPPGTALRFTLECLRIKPAEKE